jgi:hypothetical protein
MRRVEIWDNKKKCLIGGEKAPLSQELRTYFKENPHCIVHVPRKNEMPLPSTLTDAEIKNLDTIFGERLVSLWNQNTQEIISGLGCKQAKDIATFLEDPKHAHLFVYIRQSDPSAGPAALAHMDSMISGSSSSLTTSVSATKRKLKNGDGAPATKRPKRIDSSQESTLAVENRQVALYHTKEQYIFTGPEVPFSAGLVDYLLQNPDYMVYVPSRNEPLPEAPGRPYPKSRKNPEGEPPDRLVPLWDKNKGGRSERFITASLVLDHLIDNPHEIVYVSAEDDLAHQQRSSLPRARRKKRPSKASVSLLTSGSSSSLSAGAAPTTPSISVPVAAAASVNAPGTMALQMAQDPVMRSWAYHLLLQYGRLFSAPQPLFLSHASIATQLVTHANPAPGVVSSSSLSTSTSSSV